MGPSLKLWFAKMLCLVERHTAQRDCACPTFWTCVMLMSLTVATLPWQAAADTTSAPLSNASEQAQGAPRRGIITVWSNLRTSPSMQSEIVAIAREGSHVEILMETKGWYRVRNEEGVEAWIYKTLVLIEPIPLKEPSATPAALAHPDMEEIPAAAAAKPDVAAEPRPENTPAQQGLGGSPGVLIPEQPASFNAIGIEWFRDAILPYVQGLGAYVIIALVVVLVLSIALQLRAARQLRRAMQEMGEILDMVEEIYADGALARTTPRGVPTKPISAAAPARQPQPLVIEFSPIERAVLDVLFDQHDVQEGELGKLLDEKGFARIPIKAVISDIIRKTGITGLPWVEVRYGRGQFSYRLRPEVASSLSEPQSARS
jgi:SH3-like domain-containing protein